MPPTRANPNPNQGGGRGGNQVGSDQGGGRGHGREVFPSTAAELAQLISQHVNAALQDQGAGRGRGHGQGGGSPPIGQQGRETDECIGPIVVIESISLF